MDDQVVVFLLAMAALLVILVVVWVIAFGMVGQRERRRLEEGRMRQLRLEVELSELRKEVSPMKDKWLLDAQGMEGLRSQAPERYPPLSGGQTPDEFWAYWTPGRVDEWRRNRGLSA